ncbi:MAG: glycerol kinase GlpK [bacterium]|nr:glycerol kinase GlpK [bacterium]
MAEYVLGIDQSTQGTKALLFDGSGKLVCRTDLAHRQMIDEKGWVEHDPEEIYHNVVETVKSLVKKAGIDKKEIRVLGISNQRETALVWDRTSAKPVYHAVVWQCARGAAICEAIAAKGKGALVRARTGLPLSPYFSAAKIAWILQNVEGMQEKAERGELCCGTIDSWLVYRLTGGKVFRTDYSNASRTQMFDIGKLRWDEEVCGLFGIPVCCLAEVTDSDGEYGETDFEGFLDKPIPIRSVLGDSHGALFGQGCFKKGMVKTTYGTGSSIMMNVGDRPVYSDRVVTSLAWSMHGTANYVLEGNINYTGAVITWLKDDLGLIHLPDETQMLAAEANPKDTTYLVPAFSGLGSPYWDSEAKAVFYGMTRTTKRAELVKAALESIAYQIGDVVAAMQEESGIAIEELRVDGGPTKNAYLMQFQSDITKIPVQVPSAEELSGIGAAYAAGIAVGIYQTEQVFETAQRKKYVPKMNEETREKKWSGWKDAVSRVLTKQ